MSDVLFIFSVARFLNSLVLGHRNPLKPGNRIPFGEFLFSLIKKFKNELRQPLKENFLRNWKETLLGDSKSVNPDRSLEQGNGGKRERPVTLSQRSHTWQTSSHMAVRET